MNGTNPECAIKKTIFIAHSGLVPFKTLFAIQKYVFVVALVVSAILTPPDIITQVFMAVPIVLLYELGLVTAYLLRKKEKTTKETA